MKNDNKRNIFIVVLFVIIALCVLLFPQIYNYIEKGNLPEVEKTQNKVEEEKKVVDSDTLESIHFPLMRSSIYDSNTYYSLDTFTTSNMSNSDILLNAFLDIYEGNITNSSTWGRCTSTPKEFNKDYIDLRIKNILGKNIKYTLEEFYVPEDSLSSYPGTWSYDSNNSKYIYNGLCNKENSDTKYYNLEEFIKADYDNDDILAYYYVGFAKVVGNNFTIYKDANMTSELKSGTFTSVEDLNNIFKSINTKDKNIYKYTFKDTLCSYNDYCLYEGKWVDKI